MIQEGCRDDEKFYSVLARGCLQLHHPSPAACNTFQMIGMQAMQALRRLSLRSFLQQLMLSVPALRTQMEIVCRVSAHAMQAMQALRRLSLRSFLTGARAQICLPCELKWRSCA
jgi:hypothetical protein